MSSRRTDDPSEDLARLRAHDQQLTRALADSEQRFRLVLDAAPIGMAQVALDGTFLLVNPALCRLAGRTEGELLGATFQAITHPDDLDTDLGLLRDLVAGRIPNYSMEKRYLRPDGSWVWAHLSVAALRDEHGAPTSFISQVQDISEAKRLREELERMALHDQLTGLPNRSLTVDRLDQALERARRRGRPVGVLYGDIDRFKSINDTLGHAAGDAVLVEVAQRFTAVADDGDTVGRIGGDEFVVVCADVPGDRSMEPVAQRFRHALADPIEVDGSPLAVTVSVGATTGDGHDGPLDLLRDADQAMYEAKRRGRNRCATFHRPA